jgi:hypothetical protein
MGNLSFDLAIVSSHPILTCGQVAVWLRAQFWLNLARCYGDSLNLTIIANYKPLDLLLFGLADTLAQ